ncbi:transcriptional regulatory protein DegU [Paraliobacillus quinghaiensis]|uniref:Transcriptional regulatory protein DegU n=1 Tax=Paraliobacillus quinghaiensis TaxID=470815 RepID=A0A917TUJ2_9BACI|nr:response regulator transcription factor [Paraliobacillus quinghaiensis]GGM38029.1 transcriptional regulatory protein DegU [Paraliobacillus quinghaiensis]
MKIDLIKNPSLLRVGLVNALKDCFPNSDVRVYSSSDYQLVLNEYDLQDVIIIDIDTDINLSETIDLYKNANKKIILWTARLDDTSLIDLFKLQVDGYFYVEMEKKELTVAITSILNGKYYVHPSLSFLLEECVRINHKTSDKPVGILSEREWEVLELVIRGYDNEEIGQSLFISVKTVRVYVCKISKKIEVPDRTNAVLKALRNNWIYT